jgi:alpha-mannosidase
MKFQELTILLPCHSLEDFPLHHEGEEAEGLLAAWTAMWHPALLAAAGRMPGWSRADSPPEQLEGRLLIVPQVSESLLLAGWPARVKSEGGHIIRKLSARVDIVANALAEMDGQAAEVRPERVADFFALGLAYLQVELLTRQMRYMSNLDEVHFQAETLRAAEAAVSGDEETAQKHLQNCFEVLTEARERFYPAEAYILDLTLVAPTTLGEALRSELSSAAPINLLVAAETIEQLAAQDAGLLTDLSRALADRKAALIGGDYRERETPLLPPESILHELRRGLSVYQRHLGDRPRIYGRRRFGLSPVLPQILTRLGFQGALHATLEDGQFPRGDQSKVRWEGVDTSAIDALTRIPLDASRAESFLSFPTKMGESMDLDHVATIVLAHWPGQACTWYHDLRRICSFSPVMGKFVSIVDYFEQTDQGGRMARFDADQYRAPYLKQAVIRKHADPLSRLADHQRRHLLAAQQQSLRTFAALLSSTAAAETVDWRASVEAGDSVDDQLQSAVGEAATQFAAALPRSDVPHLAQPGARLVCNPFSFARKVCLELPSAAGVPEIGGPVLAAQQSGDKVCAVVEVPSLGFAWVPATGSTATPQAAPATAGRLFGLLGGKKSASKPMAEETTLRNEHIEVWIDRATGGVRSVHDYHTRGNRLSQQLGFRLPGVRPKPGDVWRDPDLEASYTEMVAEGLEITSAGPALAEIVTRGRLVGPEQRRLAGFKQTYQLWRNSPVLVIDIELDVAEEPRADGWNSYYAARFAWADEAADLYRSVGWGTQATDAKRLEAPLFVEARTENTRTTILTGGLPYHRRIGFRMLDSLLVVRGESRRRFRLGVGFDMAYSLPAALDLLAGPIVVSDAGAAPETAASSWLFHVDARNIVATHWEPLVEDGRPCGFRVRLLETEGRAGRALLRSFRPIGVARQVDFLGQTLVELPLDEGGVRLDFAGHEWVEVEARWQ